MAQTLIFSTLSGKAVYSDSASKKVDDDNFYALLIITLITSVAFFITVN